MKLQYAFLTLFITVLTSCTAPSIEQEEALFENEDVIIESVEVNASTIENEVFEAVNAYREELGLAKLEASDAIYMYADTHNDYMIRQGKISHDNFNVRARSIASKQQALAIEENVATYFPTAERVVAAWLNSTSHRETIEGDFTHTIISVKADERGKLYYTQLFYKR